ncbi:MAG: hypothetical protein PHG06_17695 [Parabacteroides sp.]|nr:hypothetical protein [Parabacteroides sp.]
MITNAIYFGKEALYETIKSNGGEWNDSKERPIVCLIRSSEHNDLYWAIPVGKWDHRENAAQTRIQKYLNYEDHDLRSCFYHLGRTTCKSIFFVSDVIPITDNYIERQYLNYDNNHYIIKNPNLLSELNRKLKRILSYENSKPNYFRQHITDIKECLIAELDK